MNRNALANDTGPFHHSEEFLHFMGVLKGSRAGRQRADDADPPAADNNNELHVSPTVGLTRLLSWLLDGHFKRRLAGQRRIPVNYVRDINPVPSSDPRDIKASNENVDSVQSWSI